LLSNLAELIVENGHIVPFGAVLALTSRLVTPGLGCCHRERDNGITIEKCVIINRKLYKLIEETALYPEGDFSLEISSPGVDEPLKLNRQFIKNIGRSLEVILNDGAIKEGKLLAATETDITIETTEGKGKKMVVEQVLITIENIKSAVVQIKF
jgi:ribosome maturation factor RimP